jgi:lipopolysaccharide transport system permease protein
MIYRAYAGIKTDQSKNYAGSLWFFLDPALSAGVYIAVGNLLKHQTPDFTAFVVVGSFVWQFIAACVTDMMGAITLSRGVIRQVHIPKIVFPVSTLLINVFKFCLTLLVLVAGLMAYGVPLSPGHLLLLPLLIVTILLILGAGLPLAAVVPFVPDTREAIRAVIRLLGFASGIFFSIQSVDASMRPLYLANPFTCMLNAYRAVLIYSKAPSWGQVAYVAGLSLALIGLGCALLFKWDRHYGKALEN